MWTIRKIRNEIFREFLNVVIKKNVGAIKWQERMTNEETSKEDK